MLMALALTLCAPDAGRLWPAFPAPSGLAVLDWAACHGFDEQVLGQTLSGVAAAAARESGQGELVWIDLAGSPSYGEWKRRLLARLRLRVDEHALGPWELLDHLRGRGVVKGYVLYQPEGGERRVYEGTPADDSLNLATSLCAPLRAVALSPELAKRADGLGLPCLADTRGRDDAWLLAGWGDKLSREVLGLQDPRTPIMRDAAVAMGAWTVHGGALMAQAAARVTTGSPVLGWGFGGEDTFTGAASRNGLFITATNWCWNLPATSCGASGLAGELPRLNEPPPAKLPDEPAQRYVSFILSDGDNVQWAMGNYLHHRDYWAVPERGQMPFGWGLPAVDLAQLCPMALDYVAETKKANDQFVLYGAGGYYYPDQFGSARGDARSAAQAVANHARRLDPCLSRLGISTMALIGMDWDNEASRAAYAAYAAEMPTLRAVWAMQYAPYSAGGGEVLWVKRPDGGELPVISARGELWAHRGNYGRAGSPNKVAQHLNVWARQPITKSEDRFAWVVVHAWSPFWRDEPQERREDSGDRGYRPALWCAEQLDPAIRVVGPEELATRLLASRHR
ncbi:MAG: hypothetical protein HZB16_22980 [Armatimonadetes bacterium]|nr:hypothetical protein [Armatimonadota bacterium]